MKISIVTVCYNSEKTIARAIESVISQKYSDLEYIIIDGGSIDSTCEIIRKYEKEISYWLSEPDKGIYDAMNKGLDAATGDVIAFLNSDDWYADNTFSYVERYFEENDVDLISGGIYFVKGGKISTTNSWKPEEIDDYFFNIGFPHPSVFAKKNLFKMYGSFDINYKIAADYDWMLRVCLAETKVLSVKECFTYFSYGGMSTLKRYDALKEQYKSAMHHMERYRKEYLRKRLQKYYEEEFGYAKRETYYNFAIEHKLDLIRKALHAERSYYIWGIGERGKQCKDLFALANINIAGFIDLYADISEYEGCHVIRPDNIVPDMYICITPKQYENEIMVQAREMGVGEEHILLFSNIIDMIIHMGELDCENIEYRM